MSPARSHLRGSVRNGRRRLWMAGAALTTALAFAAPAAHAASTTMSFTDPAGDELSGNAAVDLLSGKAVFDPATGSTVVTITASAPIGSTEGGFIIFLGQKSGDDCDYQTLQDGSNVTFVFAPVPGQTATIWTPLGQDDYGGPYNSTLDQTGGTIVMTAVDPNGLLKNKNWTCMSAQSLQSGTDGAADSAIGFIAPGSGSGSGSGAGSGSGSGSGSGPSAPGRSSTKSGTTLLPVSRPVTTTDPDADHDGVGDSADRCPALAGAQTNGCPTMPPQLEVRLGKKRIAIDKLVARSASTCPSAVRVKVTAKGKPVGSGKVSTSQFGGYCRVYGAVAIKISRKVKAVRVTMRAPGLAAIAKSAHR